MFVTAPHRVLRMGMTVFVLKLEKTKLWKEEGRKRMRYTYIQT
jgi:hypothetical protein